MAKLESTWELTPEFIEYQRQWLLARRESKIEIMKSGGEAAKVHSRADITRIDFALKRIEQKQYGLCTSCGLPIELKRLTDYQPETPFCAACAV